MAPVHPLLFSLPLPLLLALCVRQAVRVTLHRAASLGRRRALGMAAAGLVVPVPCHRVILFVVGLARTLIGVRVGFQVHTLDIFRIPPSGEGGGHRQLLHGPLRGLCKDGLHLHHFLWVDVPLSKFVRCGEQDVLFLRDHRFHDSSRAGWDEVRH